MKVILAIRTDNPEAEIGLLFDTKALASRKWLADRRLSRELLPNILELLDEADLQWSDLTGVIVFAGPGSFTGLRIGATVANSIAYSLGIPITQASDENWMQAAKSKLASTKPGRFVVPDYGAEPNITLPRI